MAKEKEMTIPSEIGAGAHRRVTDLLSLRGRIALITGATGHLGSAMAQALAEAGARVIVSSRRLVDARDVAQQLPRTAECAAHLGVELDHMEVESLGDAFASALSAANGRIDVLVNNGNAALASDWRTVTGQDFTRHLGNATGYFLLSRMMRDHVVRRGGTGSIILVGSMY